MRVVRERGATLLRGRRLLAPRPDHDQDDHDSGGGRDPGGATEAPQLARDEDDEQGGGRDQTGPGAGGFQMNFAKTNLYSNFCDSIHKWMHNGCALFIYDSPGIFFPLLICSHLGFFFHNAQMSLLRPTLAKLI